MDIFLDSADKDEIQDLAQTGLVDGITTNPSLVAKSGKDFKSLLKEITKIISGPVSAEVVGEKAEEMVQEAAKLTPIAPNIVIKVPLTWEGLKATQTLSQKGIAVNVTLCFSLPQALLAAKAGAAFVSPFIGRLDDIGEVGMDLIHEIRILYDNYENLETRILAASIRSVDHIKKAALAGADCVTIPPQILRDAVKHPLTDKGLQDFLKDWKKTGQSIL